MSTSSRRPPPDVRADNARVIAGMFRAVAERIEVGGWPASVAMRGLAHVARRMFEPAEVPAEFYRDLLAIRRRLVDGRDEAHLASVLREQASAAIKDAERLEALAASRARRKPRPKGGKHR